MAQSNTLPLDQLANRECVIDFTGKITFTIHGLKLSGQHNRHHILLLPPLRLTVGPSRLTQLTG